MALYLYLLSIIQARIFINPDSGNVLDEPLARCLTQGRESHEGFDYNHLLLWFFVN